MERRDKSQEAVLVEYKDVANMTEAQNTQVQKLAVDKQVCFYHDFSSMFLWLYTRCT